MRKIFTALTLALCIIFSATAFAETNLVKVATDDSGSKYFIEPSRVKLLKREGGELIFRADFLEIFSDTDRDRLINFYRSNGADLAALDSLTSAIIRMQFKDSGGNKNICITDLIFFDKNKKVIEGIGFKNAEIEWEPVTAGTISETLYNAAQLYI